MKNLNISSIKSWNTMVRSGEEIYITGNVWSFRDAAHKRLQEYTASGRCIPVDLETAAVFYAGPTPPPKDNSRNLAVGSCGPTTSARMDKYAGLTVSLGIACVIGKGELGGETRKQFLENQILYLCAIGGAGALASACIKKCETVLFEDLGCESVKRLYVENLPLYVAYDMCGGSIFT